MWRALVLNWGLVDLLIEGSRELFVPASNLDP